MIDITLPSSDIKGEIYNWKVTTEVFLSDHSFKIKSDPRKSYEYRNLHFTDWELWGEGNRYCKHLYNRWVCCKDSIIDNQVIRGIMPPQNRFWGAKYSLLDLLTGEFRLTDLDAFKNASKEYATGLRSKKLSSWWHTTISQTTQNTIQGRWLYDGCFSTSVRSFHQHWSSDCRTPSWDPFSRVSTNLRATIAISANNSIINSGLADCIVRDHWGNDKIWFL
jgi:hypothetical protein